MNLDRLHPASLSVTLIEIACPPGALLEAICHHDDPVILDSAAAHESFGRYSVLTCRPIEVLTLSDDKLTTRDGHVLALADEQLWPVLETALATVKLTGPRDPNAPPYGPGWFGYLGYELGRCVERLPGRARRDTPLPDLRLALHDAALVYDGIQRRWWLAELTFDEPPPGAGQAGEALRQIAAQASANPDEAPAATAEDADARVLPTATTKGDFTPEAYRQAVRRCVEYIAAGDIFQVNLSQRFTLEHAPPPEAIYRCLRRRNPAWYAAYMSFVANGQSCAVLSSSPELFLRVRDGRVVTRPIKGTRPRRGDDDDRAAAAELLASAKDNAELAMIVDLLRNDLGRVCEYGSVRVAEPRRLETHPTVFHLVATVEGRLRSGVGPAALLRATFPGGSITGAPKVRAMEIIDELEPVARGVYTGCIGWAGLDGSAEWNIAIRTMVAVGGKAHVQVGGGIVADSTPEGEYDETLAKARALLEALAEAQRANRR